MCAKCERKSVRSAWKGENEYANGRETGRGQRGMVKLHM